MQTLGPVQSQIVDVAWHPAGRWLFTADWEGYVRQWDLRTNQQVNIFECDHQVYRVACTTDGRYMVSGDQSGQVRMWELTSGQEVQRFTLPKPIFSMALSRYPELPRVLVGTADSLHVLDLESRQEWARLPHNGRVMGVDWAADNYFLTSCDDGIVRLWRQPGT
jgi:WD40 repeat protein